MDRSGNPATKLNIGCGYDKREGYLNIDMDPACNPDVLIKNNNFSNFPRREFREVLAKDVLEHIPRSNTADAILEWADLLEIGGALSLQTSSILGVADLMRRHENYANQANFTIYLFGNQAHPGDFHYTGFTTATLKIHIISAGFEIDSFSLEDHWLFAVRARKVLDWTELARTGASLSDLEFVEEAYSLALFRAPEDFFRRVDLEALESGKLSRREFLKKLYSSEERRLRISQQRRM
ncbi:MAG: methyltransferase [Burkholderia sp.]